jgi:hypothetical protein
MAKKKKPRIKRTDRPTQKREAEPNKTKSELDWPQFDAADIGTLDLSEFDASDLTLAARSIRAANFVYY